MSDQNGYFDSTNLKNVYSTHGDIIGNICKNVKESFNSDNNQTGGKKSKAKMSRNTKSVKIAEQVVNSPKEFKSPVKDVVNTESLKSKDLLSDKSLELNSNNNTNSDIINDSVSEIEQVKGGGLFYDFISYKFNIFGFEISAWIVILVIFVLLCVAYILYNYFFSKKPINLEENKNKIKFADDEEEDETIDDENENENEDEDEDENDEEVDEENLI